MFILIIKLTTSNRTYNNLNLIFFHKVPRPSSIILYIHFIFPIFPVTVPTNSDDDDGGHDPAGDDDRQHGASDALKCDYCSKVFKRKDILKRYSLTHFRPEKHHICGVCQKPFSLNSI